MPEGLKTNILAKISDLASLANAELSLHLRLQKLTTQLSEILWVPACMLYLESADSTAPKIVIGGVDGQLAQALRAFHLQKTGEQYFDALLQQVSHAATPESMTRVAAPKSLLNDTMFAVLPLFEGQKKIGALILATTATAGVHEIIADSFAVIAKQVALLILLFKATQPENTKSVALATNNKDLFAEEFLATLSHELRSPLQTIIGWVSLLQHQTGDKDLLLLGLQTIERSARQQNLIVNELLDASYSFTQQLLNHKQPVLVQSLLRQVINTLHPKVVQKQQTIAINIEEGEDYVLADAERLMQALDHILANAIKFTPEQGQLFLAARRIKNTYQIVLRDTGVGIEADFLPFVFEPFRQEESTTTRRFRGLGLGLAIARHQIEAHGGNIEIQSSGKNLGTTVWIHLPIDAATTTKNEAAAEIIMPEKNEASSTPQDLSGIRVLVVGNDSASLETVRTILQRNNSDVQTTDSAHNALQLIHSWTPDILISDVQMSDLTGYELMQRVRDALGNRPHRVNAIALTHDSRATERIRALASGFQTHVPKPVNPTELMAVVSSLVAQPKSLPM